MVMLCSLPAPAGADMTPDAPAASVQVPGIEEAATGSAVYASMNGVDLSTPVVVARSLPVHRAEVWATCAVNSPTNKVVRTFTQRAGNPSILYGNSNLTCGRESGNGLGWGFQHISFKHGAQGEWGELAFMTGGNWRDLADFAIEQTLRVPGSMSRPQSNGTIAYRAPIQFFDIDDDTLQAEYTVVVSISIESKNIITAFPEEFD